MTTHINLNKPEKRRSILVLKQTDIDNAKLNNQAEFLLDDQLLVLPHPFTVPDNLPIELNSTLNEVLPGELLLQSPYDTNHYVRADAAQVQFAIDKYFLFSELCSLLGAKEVSVTQGKVWSKNGTSTFSVDAEHHVVDLKTDIKNSIVEKLIADISLHDKFVGSSANIDAAEELLKRNHLTNDRQMSGLINLRKEGINQIIERTLNINMTSETSNRLSICGRLKTPGITLACEYNKIADENLSFTVSVTVKF